MDGDVDLVCCDMPQATRLTLHIMAAMAEHEREMISTRTKAALAAAKGERSQARQSQTSQGQKDCSYISRHVSPTQGRGEPVEGLATAGRKLPLLRRQIECPGHQGGAQAILVRQ